MITFGHFYNGRKRVKKGVPISVDFCIRFRNIATLFILGCCKSFAFEIIEIIELQNPQIIAVSPCKANIMFSVSKLFP